MVTKSDLEKLKENLKKLEEEGRKVQQQANEATKYAATGRKQVEFLEVELPKYKAIAEASPDFRKLLPQNDSWTQQAVKDSENALTGLMQAGHDLNRSFNFIGTAVSNVTSVGTSAISELYWISEQHPESRIFQSYQLQDPKPFVESTDDEILSKLLAEYDPELEHERQGAWQAFYSSSDAKDSQSSHSMRDVVRKFINKHASNDDVKKAKWWTEVEGTKDGVSVRQRLRLLAYGPTGEASEAELDLMEQQLEKFERSYKLLNKAAHGSKQAAAAIEASMKSAEQLILLVLKRHALTTKPPERGVFNLS